MLKKEDLIDGKIYYHRTDYNEWIITFKEYYGNEIIGYNCLNKNSDTFRSNGYSNTSTKEFREANTEEVQWLNECIRQNKFVPKNEVKFNIELEYEIC